MKDLQKYIGSAIDILIPAHNSSQSIDKVIRNLASQNVPINSKVNIVVCANACKDHTLKVAKKALECATLQKMNIKTLLIETSQPGEPQALNRMLKKISNDIVIVVNDDVEPSQNSLATLYVAMKENPKICAIGVPSRPSPNFVGVTQVLPIRIANRINQLYLEKDITIVGRMYAFRKSIVNHFPNIMSEDNFLTYMSLIKSSGYGIVKDGRSYVYYNPPSTYSDVFNQTFMHSISGVQFFRKYPDSMNMFFSIEKQMHIKEIKEEHDDKRKIHDIAQQIQDCCWQMAVLADKLKPINGSFRKRVISTIF